MDIKRLLRGPIVWIVLAVVVVIAGTSLFTGSGFKEVRTQQGLSLLKGGTVSVAKIVDTDQRVDLTLSKADGALGTQVQFYYVAPRGPEIVKAVTDSGAKYDDSVPQTSFWSSI